MAEYRINGFEQIKAFYSWVFNNQDKNINTSHVSLYVFLINQNNRNNWVEWFKLPYDLGMTGACIGSRNTYYKCLKDLKEWKLIEYNQGVNNWRAPVVKLCLLKNEQVTEQVPVPLSEQVTEPLPIQLIEQLPEHIYKLLTNNLKLITNNFNDVEKFILNLSTKSDYINDVINCFAKKFEEIRGISYEIMNKGKERGCAAKILKKYKTKYPDKNSEDTIKGLGCYFEQCLMIDDNWLNTNMSIPIIVNKFNEINNILKNGNKQRKNGTGTTDRQLANTIAKHFSTGSK